MDQKRLPRREREKIARRDEIFSAALDLFSEKGYHNVSMHEIAEKAEFAIGTLYKFFENKEALYKALVMEQAEKFHSTLTRAIEEPVNEIEKIRNYIRAKGEVFTANVSMIRLYFAETRGASFNIKAGLDTEIQEMYEEFLKNLASVFNSGIKKRLFKKILDPYYLAVAIDSLTSAFLLLWLEAPDRHPYPEDPDVILNILLKGLVDP
ncbi:MAG: TetR/AcrR family transcriptional regulator [Deltaproteobacteria bacterium]|nr:TetR/AcrR family transcriptional regulator [Deltaproteobacteria bacterium]MBW2086338.1 TetR/AcrR family transcriptional regulator [Deltaproteobacteria bacterium]